MARRKAFATQGDRVAAFLESFVCHTKGKFAGDPFKVEPWQLDFLRELYRVDDAGRRIYTEGLLLIPRKNGKSTLAAGLALYHLIADGESSPECFVAAGSREQAGAVFRQAKAMVEASPRLQDWITPLRYHLESKGNGGVFRTLSSDATLQHGTNPSASIIDEYWGARTSDMLVALTSGTGARDQPLTLTISTVGHDKKSPLGELHKQAYELPDSAREIRNNGYLTVARDEANGFLYWMYGPPVDPADLRATVDLEEEEQWALSNPASWITTDYLRRQRNKPSVRPADFQRFHLNAWSDSEDYWLPSGAWESGRNDFETIEDGALITLGIDIGLRRDRSSVVAVRRREVDDEHHFDVLARVWEPPIDENIQFDIAEIRAYVRELGERFNVERVAFDPWRFEESGQALEDEGLPMVRFSMAQERTCPASEALYDAIVSGRVHHDGDPILAAHVSAGATSTTERGWRLTKRKATEPIDALMALLMAHAESMAALGHGAGSIYEERDLITL